MGTHPIFESDFDCLTDMESKTKTLLGELRAQRQKWQNITLLTIEKNEKISPKLFISAEELCDSGTSSGESEQFFISVHEKYINEDAEKRELRQKIEKHRQKFIEIYASYPELAHYGKTDEELCKMRTKLSREVDELRSGVRSLDTLAKLVQKHPEEKIIEDMQKWENARVDSLERLSRITGRSEEEIENEIRRLPTI